jgi:hypothetical protein
LQPQTPAVPPPPQVAGAVHVVPPQHASPTAPQAQVWLTQVRLLPQAAPAVQHCSFSPPHGLHVLAEHISPRLHEFPLQHGSLAPPQATQVDPLQRLPAAHIWPEQQGCEAAPQAPQVPFMHVSPPVQLGPLEQHGCPAPPQTHAPPTQIPPVHGVESGLFCSVHWPAPWQRLSAHGLLDAGQSLGT